MAKPVLAIDIDEVLFPHIRELTKFYNRLHKANFKLEDYVVYEFRKVWKRNTEAEVSEVVDAFLELDHRDRVQPLPQAKEVLRRLRRRYRLVVITSRDGKFEDQTKSWLAHHFPGYFDSVEMVGNEFTGLGFRSKAELCRELGAVALIDDGLTHTAECAEIGRKVLLFGNYPWNQAKVLPPGVERVADWPAAERALG